MFYVLSIYIEYTLFTIKFLDKKPLLYLQTQRMKCKTKKNENLFIIYNYSQNCYYLFQVREIELYNLNLKIDSTPV